MSGKKHHAEELSYFNAIACLLVIFIHVVSYGINTVAPESVQAAVIYFPWRLAAFVVPAFLFSSAVKMAFQYEEQCSFRQYAGYAAGRVKKIYLPYILWNVIYYAVFTFIGYVRPSSSDFFRQLFTGTLSAPFYYVVIAMQFYLLKPLWFWILGNLRWYIVVPGAVIITFLSLYLNAILGLWGLSFAYVGRLFTSYLVFWIVGLYAGRNWERLTESLKHSGKSMAVGAVLVLPATVIPYLQFSTGARLFDVTYHKVFTDIISIAILLWICLNLRQGAVQKCLSFVSRASFSVYLSHCLFLSLAEVWIRRAGLTKISVILMVRCLVCYSVPFLLYALGCRLRAAFRKRSPR